MKFVIPVEDSMYKTHIINLGSFDEVIIPKKTDPWARGGDYYTISVRLGEVTTKYMVDTCHIDAYKMCLRHNISQEDYVTYTRVEELMSHE